MNGSERALIEFREVDVAFGDHLVLGKLSLEVRRGEIDTIPALADTVVALHLAVLAARPWQSSGPAG